MANIFTQKPYQTNQSTDPKKAAASSVSSQPPANAFMQGLNGAWSGLKNAVGGVGNWINTEFSPDNTGKTLALNQAISGVKNLYNTTQAKQNAMWGDKTNQVAQNPPPAVDLKVQPPVQNPPPKVLGDTNLPVDPNAQKKADLQAQIDALQGKVSTAQSQGASATTQLDANGNPIKSGGSTTDQNNVITKYAETQNPDLRQQVINSQAAIAPNAQANLNTAQENLKNFQTGYAQSVGKIEGEPIGLDFQQGQKQVIANQYANELPAYTQAVNTAQTALGQGVQANSNVIGATQPQLSQYGETYYKPPTSALGGTQDGGQQVATTDPFYTTMQTYANLSANNQGASIPTSITGNSVLNAQLLNMAKAINPNFNPNVAAGVGSAQSSTAATQTAQIQAWQSSLQQGRNLQTQFTDLLNTFGLNPSDINAVNAGIQKIAQNTSSTQYKMLSNYVADIANTYAQILTPSGSNVSDYKTQIANSMLDQTAKGTSMIDVMKGLDNQAEAKIAGVSTTSNFNQNNGNTNSNTANPWH